MNMKHKPVKFINWGSQIETILRNKEPQEKFSMRTSGMKQKEVQSN